MEQLSRAPQTSDDARTLSTLIIRESDRLSRLLGDLSISHIVETEPEGTDPGPDIERDTGIFIEAIRGVRAA